MIENMKLKLEKWIECKMKNNKTQNKCRDVAIEFVYKNNGGGTERERERSKWTIISYHNHSQHHCECFLICVKVLNNNKNTQT